MRTTIAVYMAIILIMLPLRDSEAQPAALVNAVKAIPVRSGCSNALGTGLDSCVTLKNNSPTTLSKSLLTGSCCTALQRFDVGCRCLTQETLKLKDINVSDADKKQVLDFINFATTNEEVRACRDLRSTFLSGKIPRVPLVIPDCSFEARRIFLHKTRAKVSDAACGEAVSVGSNVCSKIEQNVETNFCCELVITLKDRKCFCEVLDKPTNFPKDVVEFANKAVNSTSSIRNHCGFITHDKQFCGKKA